MKILYILLSLILFAAPFLIGQFINESVMGAILIIYYLVTIAIYWYKNIYLTKLK